MIPKGLLMQIGIIIVSITIVLTHIEPAFGEIGRIQDDIALYESERQKVLSVNSKLDALVARMESVSIDDQKRLLSYLPDKVDDITVSRDLFLIVQQSGVLYHDVKYSGAAKEQSSVDEQSGGTLEAHEFTLSVEGTYEQIKNLFRTLEKNNYPLEIRQVNLGKQEEGSLLHADITIATYAFQSEVINEPTL